MSLFFCGAKNDDLPYSLEELMEREERHDYDAMEDFDGMSEAPDMASNDDSFNVNIFIREKVRVLNKSLAEPPVDDIVLDSHRPVTFTEVERGTQREDLDRWLDMVPCVRQQTVRTNNDAGGWHDRINKRMASVGPSFYVLVPPLLEEADAVELIIKLVSEMALIRYQCQKYKNSHHLLFSLWEKCEDVEINISRLLRDVSYIQGFAPVGEVGDRADE